MYWPPDLPPHEITWNRLRHWPTVSEARGWFGLAGSTEEARRAPLPEAEQFRAILEAMPNAVVVISRARRIHRINRRAEELFRYDRDELLGQGVEILVPERFRAEHPGLVEGFFHAPATRPMGAGRDLYGRRKDGSEFPVEIGLNPLAMEGEPHTLASIIDISERKRAQAVHDRLAAIVESSEDAILSKTLEGVVTSWNHGAQRLFGYTEEEAVGGSVFLIIPPEEREAEMRLLEQLAAGQHAEHVETRRLRKDGAVVEISARLSPLRDGLGRVIGASSIMRDITEQKRRDTELRRSNAELEQFAYVASHDLQEPLRMVANYVELLAERYSGQLDERADKYIGYASDGARRMQRMVADLLAFSRVGSEGKPLGPVACDAVLDQVVASLGALIREQEAAVERGPLPEVLGDETQLVQLFQNLIANAIKFRGERPPVVRISAVLSGAAWQFSVADNGIGIAMQHAARIFQMFQRLHARGRYPGSGIGLAIAKRIVERHGGRIWLESPPGQGATFHFTLRAAPRKRPT